MNSADYARYRSILQSQRLPLAFVDLERFDANVAYVAGQVRQFPGKTIRVGSKSIRCAGLMERIFAVGGAAFHGLLTYTVEETAWLASKGFQDLIVAYPTIQPADIDCLVQLARQGHQVRLMVDCLEQLQVLAAAGQRAGVVLQACLEVDMAYRPLSSRLHLGLRRSPIRTVEQAVTLVRQAQGLAGVRISALMGYEGHIAGTNDEIPGKLVQNWLLRQIKGASVRELTRRRGAIVQALQAEGLELEVVNGGGSGSLRSSLADPSVNEVTVGSGFYAPGLFHHFHEVHYQPAAFFALQVVRKPAPGIITCAGGGYVASGAVGPDKLPLPVYPPGAKYISLEGAGEVQTPLQLPAGYPNLQLGDPVIFQHAKAGELAERFTHFHLVREKQMAGTMMTYRGEGKAFL